MTKKKIFILLGHPDKETKCGCLADSYERGAKEAGHEVRRTNIGDLKFDPILHKGYKVIQALEPDLAMVQENIKWCDHFVIFYPSWWSTMPALLKGMFDRMWLPGFAFNFNKNGRGWNKHLKGRSALVVVSSDSHPLIARILMGDSTNEIKRGILKFAGFAPVRILKVGPLKNISQKKKEKWERKLLELGEKGA
ncbi:NAD(P)H-dependent oxidoreductase [Patescibacteria group bacterium]|nr:NAD(P)H-dependent oxidoreductase [Patescibacteria group bacterium]MDE1988402.1 NAD(P)H-dependent oxidoreductase [Patescibacteria group bacterium]